MEDLDKRKVYALIQKSLQEVSNEKTQIVSFAPYYVIDGTSGVKFTVKKRDVELNFFAGFSTDKKYSEKLLFGILKSESNEKIEKLNLDKDENGNNIQGKFSIDEKFLSADEDTQKSKLTKWLSEQITTVFVLYKMWNKSPRNSKNSDSTNWFKTVELPWIVTLLGIVPTCFCPIFAETNETIFMALAASGSLIFLAGVIAIIATIGKKREIRNERNLPLTKNPYTWFVSYIGKVVCGTTILCLGIGVFILIALFAAGVSSSSSGYTSSSSRSSSASGHNDSKNFSQTKAGTEKSFNSTMESTEAKSSSKKTKYYCEYCGQDFPSISLLSGGLCPLHPDGSSRGRHKLYEGTEKTYYFCKYCGLKTTSIKSLTGGSCPKHPKGSCKGRHQPAL